MGKINVLMCGGRRTGKTSIMAAIQQNVEEMFPRGDIVLNMEKGGELVAARTDMECKFGPEYADEMTFRPDEKISERSDSYPCRIYLKDRKSNMELEFTDIPGEWFIKEIHKKDLRDALAKSQILIIAIDSPHLMEEKGMYHEVYNRAAVVSDEIKKMLQGNKEPRMVLFVPVKCERYRSTQEHPSRRMKALLQEVEKGYKDLISFLTERENKQIYTVAAAPCFTVGGAEFLRFIPAMDEDGELELDEAGNPLEAIVYDPHEGMNVMTYQTEYRYLEDRDGDHYYAPAYCEQSLLFILLYVIAVSRINVSSLFGMLLAMVRGLPDKKILAACKQELLEKLMREEDDGFKIINDPLKMCEPL